MSNVPATHHPTGGEDDRSGAQRLPLAALRAWEQLEFGMFIHFGMSTYDGDEFSKGDKPSTLYAPDRLDVDQWIGVAAEAGMRYAVLTVKHVAGHCLWPSDLTDYHVGTSGNSTDVVEAFVAACGKHRIIPGFYYCSWDNHHLLGSLTPTYAGAQHPFTTRTYRDFQLGQIEELLSRYGPIGEVWIDIPHVLGADGRREQYDQIAKLAPDAVIAMNSGFRTSPARLDINRAWPTDVYTIEADLPRPTDVYTIQPDPPPHPHNGHNPWHQFEPTTDDHREYYVPAEVCDQIGRRWFHFDDDPVRSDVELLGMRLICRSRHANLLLNVPPNKHGRISDHNVEALRRLTQNLDKFG